MNDKIKSDTINLIPAIVTIATHNSDTIKIKSVLNGLYRLFSLMDHDGLSVRYQIEVKKPGESE